MYNVSFPALGWEFEINPGIQITDNFAIHWYGVIIAVGLLLAVVYGYYSAPRFNVNKDKLIDCVIVGVVTGVIGARLYYCLFQWEEYISDPIRILKINEGGLAIYGGIIGALLGGCLTAKIRKQKILPILDVTMLGFLIGQGIGRWGNFMNQEAFGSPTNLPWGMSSVNTGNIPVHPCFLYESIWCLLGFVLLHFYSKKHQKYSGQVFYMYLVWYGFERMIVEGLRTDSLYLPFQLFGYDIRVSQALSFCIFVAGITLLIVNRHKEDNFYADYRRKKSISSGEGTGSSAGEGVTE